MAEEAVLPKLDPMPPEMIEFTLLKTTGALAPRLGRIALAGRQNMVTPAYIGNTSRGIVPHISQDNFRKTADINGVYVPLEDFIEKHPQQVPPVLQYDVPNPLRRFIALPEDTLLVLGARRNPPIAGASPNTNTEVGLSTSVGFRSLSSEYYAAAVRRLQPDIVVALADIPFGQQTIGSRRKDKMSDRTETWLRDMIACKDTLDQGEKSWSIFAPILPLERDLQSWYLEHLLDDMVDHISGLAIYDTDLLDDLPLQLHHFPRLSLHAPASPHALLRQVGLGVDLFTVPFLAEATDAGIVLDFTFPPPAKHESTSTRQILGIDMWHEDHAISVRPLSEGCTCYACTKHHRAYLQHLLAAKEMLGWVLIQLHNHAIIARFFQGVRASIDGGTFDADVAAFDAYYEPALPEKTGQGPRVRGYQFTSEEHAKKGKKNPTVYKNFDAEKMLGLKAAHGQQPNKKPEMRHVFDDQALLGLVGMEELGIKADPDLPLGGLRLEHDGKA
ncbi:tRNA-guanine(15) transglycosylase-like protein [Ampelomyces quisqualis]|uniref:Queuine tRNA-ribosyltransferase accessory subunit 2 n=1 Tax=Ampelomyces quisqualis TaxID=50730 RepID=A0A6A5QVS6_AMPQU|nr:tRNA-guanine(15) transglycosylase-like protein [Ampelomyces quisqualis]